MKIRIVKSPIHNPNPTPAKIQVFQSSSIIPIKVMSFQSKSLKIISKAFPDNLAKNEIIKATCIKQTPIGVNEIVNNTDLNGKLTCSPICINSLKANFKYEEFPLENPKNDNLKYRTRVKKLDSFSTKQSSNYSVHFNPAIKVMKNDKAKLLNYNSNSKAESAAVSKAAKQKSVYINNFVKCPTSLSDITTASTEFLKFSKIKNLKKSTLSSKMSSKFNCKQDKLNDNRDSEDLVAKSPRYNYNLHTIE